MSNSKAPLVVQGPGEDITTVVHFGFDMASGPDETSVGILQDGQYVKIACGQWSEIESEVNEYFEGKNK